jgi:hypothetical protein
MSYQSYRGFLNLVLFPLLIFFSQAATAQADTAKLRVIVSDSYTKRGVEGASVVNRTSGTVAKTDINGYVEAKAMRTDQLYIFATGYHSLPFSIADSTGKQTYFLRLIIEPFTAGLSQSVIILGNKSLEGIGTDRKSLGQTPAELKKPKIPVLDVLDYLSDKVGARGKEREKLKKEMVADDKWKVMTEYLNYCNERKLISLPAENYNDFITYCDMSVAYLKARSDYEIISAISSKFETYKKEKGWDK